MKKLFAISALIIGLLSGTAFAKTVPVQTLQDFSLENPPQTLLIKILSNIRLNKDIMLHEGFYVLGQIQASQDSGFIFMPVKYQNFHNEVFEVQGNYPAKFVEVLENSDKKAKGQVNKDSKILFDFVIADEQQDDSIGERFKDADATRGISAIVNKSEMVIYDDTIPATMRNFPGIKLNSFDNGSNFNIPKKLIIDYSPKEININSLKETPEIQEPAEQPAQ